MTLPIRDIEVELPKPANDVPLIIMVGPNEELRVQRAVFSAVGVRFLGFRHGDTALLALLTSPASAIMVSTPADMPADHLIAEMVSQGEVAPIIRLGEDHGMSLPQSPAAARSLLVRVGVLNRRLRTLS